MSQNKITSSKCAISVNYRDILLKDVFIAKDLLLLYEIKPNKKFNNALMRTGHFEIAYNYHDSIYVIKNGRCYLVNVDKNANEPHVEMESFWSFSQENNISKNLVDGINLPIHNLPFILSATIRRKIFKRSGAKKLKDEVTDSTHSLDSRINLEKHQCYDISDAYLLKKDLIMIKNKLNSRVIEYNTSTEIEENKNDVSHEVEM